MTFDLVTTGDESVIDAFFSPTSRLGIVACSGGNRSAMTSGCYVNLRRRRLGLKPVAFAGVSSGIPTTAYFIGKGVAPDNKVFIEDTSDKRLFRMSRRLWGQFPFDVDYINRVFRGTETGRGIKAHEVIAHPAPLYSVVGHAETGESLIFRPKTAEDVWKLASYGTAITGFSRRLEYNGLPITDGFFTDQMLPVRWLAERESLTDVLVFACRHREPDPRETSWFERILYSSGFAPANKTVRELVRTRHIRFASMADQVVNIPGLRVLIVWIPERIPAMKVSQEKARQLVWQGYRTMDMLFERRGY